MSIPSRHKDNHEQVQQLSVMLGKAEGFHMCERHNTLDGSLEAGRDDLLGCPPMHTHTDPGQHILVTWYIQYLYPGTAPCLTRLARQHHYSAHIPCFERQKKQARCNLH